MKVYLVVRVNSSFLCLTGKCFANLEKAEKYCSEKNKDIYSYLKLCSGDNKTSGNQALFEVREIEVIEDE